MQKNGNCQKKCPNAIYTKKTGMDAEYRKRKERRTQKEMEKVIFTDPETGEAIEFFVLEETQINGSRFLFVTEEEDGDSDAYILKEVADENEEIIYEMVEDEKELAALGKVFAELIEDADIEY